MSEKKQYVFIEANQVNKTYENGNQRSFYFLKLADPLTFENHTVSYNPNLDIHRFRKGQKITIELDLVTQFNRTNVEVVQINEAK